MTTPTNAVEHLVFCLPRPGESEVRMESYGIAKYADDGMPNGTGMIIRCLECGSHTVDGRQVRE